jgi:hypothetical protein
MRRNRDGRKLSHELGKFCGPRIPSPRDTVGDVICKDSANHSVGHPADAKDSCGKLGHVVEHGAAALSETTAQTIPKRKLTSANAIQSDLM